MATRAGTASALVLTGEIKIRATHKIMASRTTELALFVDQFVPATQTITPVFTCVICCIERAGFGQRQIFILRLGFAQVFCCHIQNNAKVRRLWQGHTINNGGGINRLDFEGVFIAGKVGQGKPHAHAVILHSGISHGAIFVMEERREQAQSNDKA
jgi:hypothetical protein